MNHVIRIDLEKEKQRQEERFSRFHLIPWWDQEKLSQAKVLVIGVGALGNELVKNLALLGIGNLMVVDLDLIENSNLCRSVLFREEDEGRKKAEVGAEAAKQLYPDVKVNWLHGNVVYDLGLGVYRWADIVLAGLDNREARLSINENCYRVNRPWIDGAIEQLNGVARMFMPPDGPCYECTMNERDWELLEMRRSCNLLSREEMEAGKVPTTPTTASVIAGIQAQEAVKYLHGLPTFAGRGYIFNGVDHSSYEVQYVRKESCYSHETYEPIYCLDKGVSDVTLHQLLELGKKELGEDAVVELNNEVLHSLECRRCGAKEEILTSLGKVTQKQGRCPQCDEMREVQTLHTISGNENFLCRTPAEIGVPPYDIVGLRSGMEQIFVEFTADAPRVLGTISGGEEAE